MFVSLTGEYIQLPLQLDEILQDVLQIACDLNSDEPEVILEYIYIIQLRSFIYTLIYHLQEEISSDGSKAVAQKLDPADGAPSEQSTNSVDTFLPDVEISSNLSDLNIDDATELEQFDMMIQSAGPFQHPRSSQAYGHGTNTFRQSYHHQVRNLYTHTYTMKISFAISAIFSFLTLVCRVHNLTVANNT